MGRAQPGRCRCLKRLRAFWCQPTPSIPARLPGPAAVAAPTPAPAGSSPDRFFVAQRTPPKRRARSGSQKRSGREAIAPATETPRHALADPPAQVWRILIVEDNARTAETIREALALEGDQHWQVQIAPSGEEALALLIEQPVDLVLLDVRLPGISGAEVYRRLRADPATLHLPIIFLSGGTSFDLFLEGIQEGILLRKPFNVLELLTLVRANLPAARP